MAAIEPSEDGFGARVDDDLLEGVSFSGFLDDEGGGDAGSALIFGFEEATEPGSAGGAAPIESPRRAARVAFRDRVAGLLDRAAAGWQNFLPLVAELFRMRRVRTALVVAVAVVLSAGAGLWIRNLSVLQPFVPRQVAAPTAAPLPPRSVLVARAVLPPGHILREQDLRWQRWPDTLIGNSYIVQGNRSPRDFVGHVVRNPIAAGEPISDANVIAPNGRGFMSAVVRPGMRAVSVAISPETAAGGLIMPGDRVNVMFGMALPKLLQGASDAPEWSVQTVAENIRVLAIDQELDPASGRAIGGRTATLEVTPKEAELITLADYMAIEDGRMTLSLRSLVPDATAAARNAGPSYAQGSDLSVLLPKRESDESTTKMTRLPMIVRGGSLRLLN